VTPVSVRSTAEWTQGLTVEVLPNKATAAKKLAYSTWPTQAARSSHHRRGRHRRGDRSLFLVCVVACVLADVCVFPIKSAR
jgi:hypothetical protein